MAVRLSQHVIRPILPRAGVRTSRGVSHSKTVAGSADALDGSGTVRVDCHRLAFVAYRNGEWIIGSYAQASKGVWRQQDEFSVLPASAAKAEIAASVMVALWRSGARVPNSLDRANEMKPLLQVAGVPSWRAYLSGTHTLAVMQNNIGPYTLLPTANRGHRAGFVFQPDARREITAKATPAVLGAAIQAAFVSCT